VGNPADLADHENFIGGFYELSVEVGTRDDDRLWRTADAVWHHAGIEGCYRLQPPPPEPVQRSLDSFDRFGQLHGVVRLPIGGLVVCSMLAFRDDSGGSDSLDFSIPLGALSAAGVRVGGYPFGSPADCRKALLLWRKPLDSWLIGIARRTYDEVNFKLALVGFEVGMDQFNGEVPEERPFAYLVPDASGALHVHGATI